MSIGRVDADPRGPSAVADFSNDRSQNEPCYHDHQCSSPKPEPPTKGLGFELTIGFRV